MRDCFDCVDSFYIHIITIFPEIRITNFCLSTTKKRRRKQIKIFNANLIIKKTNLFILSMTKYLIQLIEHVNISGGEKYTENAYLFCRSNFDSINH